MMGDANFDATYSDWRDVNRAKFPFHITYTLNGHEDLRHDDRTRSR